MHRDAEESPEAMDVDAEGGAGVEGRAPEVTVTGSGDVSGSGEDVSGNVGNGSGIGEDGSGSVGNGSDVRHAEGECVPSSDTMHEPTPEHVRASSLLQQYAHVDLQRLLHAGALDDATLVLTEAGRRVFGVRSTDDN